MTQLILLAYKVGDGTSVSQLMHERLFLTSHVINTALRTAEMSHLASESKSDMCHKFLTRHM